MKYIFDLNEADVLVISRALGELPYKDVAGLITKMNQQIAASVAADRQANEPVGTELASWPLSEDHQSLNGAAPAAEAGG